MKTILTFCFLFINCFIFSQNWEIINSNEHYHYKEKQATFYTNTILVDSVFFDGIDSLFFLNTICKPCDNCSSVGTYIAYAPQFLNKIVRKKIDGYYEFYQPDTFIINSHALLNDTWIYTIQGSDTINATVIYIDSANILGNLDSVKYIRLSNDDTLLLSKSFGLVNMTQLIDSQDYELIGLEKAHIGFTLPIWSDFFNFNVGDSLFYYSEADDYGCIQNPEWHFCNIKYFEKNIILDKIILDTSIIYLTHLISNTIDRPHPDLISGRDLNLNLVYSKSNLNYDYTYNNMLEKLNNMYYVRKIELINNRIKFARDSFLYYQDIVGDTSFLYRAGMIGDAYRNEFITGLGKTSSGFDFDFEGYNNRKLICYNDTSINDWRDVSCVDYYLLSSIKNSSNQFVDINYTEDYINIINGNNEYINYILYNQLGSEIICGTSRNSTINIPISNFNNGIYYLNVQTKGVQNTFKIVR